ncbi:MAG: hypothetical protein ACI4OP_03310, partial [Candidatus Coprovivens sp.]
MIQINNVQLRNLTEQVQRNKEDIKYILTEGRQFDEFGIKVVGQVATVNDLPDPVEYHTQHGDDSYGDAYMVGTSTPYTLYILTREFSGTTGPHWFDVGEFPLQGPQGDKGDPGHSPDVSIKNGNWYIDGVDSGKSAEGLKGDTGNGITSITKTSTSGLTDTYTIAFTNGTVTKYNVQNGAPGPRGLTGTPGNAVSIIGIITTEDELPTPTEEIRNNAYLLNKGNNVYDMYIILGESTLVWTNVGEFNSGTQITVNGSNVATFDADSKQDKMTASEPLQLSSNGELSFSYGYGLTVENGGLQLSLGTNSPMYYYDGTLGMSIGNGLTTDSDGYLTIYTDMNQLTVENGLLELSSNLLNSGFNSNDGSYIQDNYGNLDVYGHGELRLQSNNNIQINPTMSSYKTIIASGTTANQSLGIVLDDSGQTITMGTLSDYETVDKTKPYIEITETAVNIKG